MMKRCFFVVLALAILSGCRPPVEDIRTIADGYVAAWVGFYPSQALSAGRAASAFEFEDYSTARIVEWETFNRQILATIESLPPTEVLDDLIDQQLLERQIRREIFRWAELQAHRTDPLAYSNLINHSLTPVLVRQNLTDQQKIDSVMNRLEGLRSLCATARNTLTEGRPASTDAAGRHIRSTAEFIERNLISAMTLPSDPGIRQELETSCTLTAHALNDLAQWLEDDLKPRISLHDSYGQAQYSRELGLAFGPNLTPEKLEQIALTEIHTVRGLMDELVLSHQEPPQTEPAPENLNARILPALAAMERNRAHTQAEFLKIFSDLIDRSEVFVHEKDLIDLPEHRTLFTDLSPTHFAGAAVGGVYSAGPFDPEAETLFYLPTVPDSAPEPARDGFYRSFNNHFNTMIITHEIYPGHYLQLKAAAYHPRRVRGLFTGDDFTEGWASFCEQMMLDAGWDDNNHLTRLAHLRKRLENAVRAYVSVQVHCRGWSREELQTFAVETGLLPPQFAENLWHRALFSPIQLPSYFVGFRRFTEVFELEQERLSQDFSVKAFNNAVVHSGGIPLRALADYISTQVKESDFG